MNRINGGIAVIVAFVVSIIAGGCARTTSGATDAVDTFVSTAQHARTLHALTSDPQSVVFTGCLKKQKTSDPRTLGAHSFLANDSSITYRIRQFAYVINTSGLLLGESAESDVGFTVLPPGKLVSLDSGQEILIQHLYDASPQPERIIRANIPLGGIKLKPGDRLNVGAVSGIYQKSGGGAQIISNSRIAGGKFMQVCYRVELMRADLVSAPPVFSYRSPYRDRSFVASPGRLYAPYTDFKNTSNATVRVYGLGVFLSNLTDNLPSGDKVDVLVNGKATRTFTLPPHIPGTTTPLFSMILPMSLSLSPGAVISVRAQIKTGQALVYDFASYLFAGKGLTPTGGRLDVLRADLNGDGYKDTIDIGPQGGVWVSMTGPMGLETTEQEWANGLGSVTSLKVLKKASPAAPAVLRATNPQGLCLNLRADPSQDLFIVSYCKNDGAQSTPNTIWGDFTGNGWLDRMTINPSALTYSVALGGPNGLGPQKVWASGYGTVSQMFVGDATGNGKDDIEAQWTDAAGFHCVVWMSTGTSFNKAPCGSINKNAGE